ncbi:MAG: hypothetical protein EAZ15_06455 [Sphingobacteriales bacterium]|nr:MAG: hypothetical protein EAZ15_06455 [Sphingobacteriales bacterium]
MSLIVETKSKQEEKVLKAFLDSLSYTYQPYNNESDTVFLAQYNYDLAQADAEIDEGNYLSQQQVEQLFNNRAK